MERPYEPASDSLAQGGSSRPVSGQTKIQMGVARPEIGHLDFWLVPFVPESSHLTY
jgi:hypothetical protein